jgi:SAM-dependent methyltransferase
VRLVSAELVDYYRRRASVYEAIYEKPERQDDLEFIRQALAPRLQGARVLEIACGTGYWTERIAPAAASVVATDLADETLRIAQAKRYPPRKLSFLVADAYALSRELGTFDAAFAGFWWSHIPLARIDEFLVSLHSRLERGARVLFLDNRYVEGNSTPISEVDADGNTYQLRSLPGGTTVRVLKNFPSEAELRERLSRFTAALRFELLQYYWITEYQLK